MAAGPKRAPGRKLAVESNGAPKRQILPSAFEDMYVLIVSFPSIREWRADHTGAEGLPFSPVIS
jgi:hypothetical protein